MKVEVPKYLKKRWRERHLTVIAMFRCENQERVNKFWKSEEGRTCKKFSQEVETIEHLNQNYVGK